MARSVGSSALERTKTHNWTGDHFDNMPHSTSKTPSDSSQPSPSDKFASFLCFRTKANTLHEDASAIVGRRSYSLPYRNSVARTAPLLDHYDTDDVSDTSSVYSQPTYAPPDNSTVISYSVPPMANIVRPILQNETSACPQFYIMISGSFSLSKALFCRRLFSNSHHPCSSLEPHIQQMMQEAIHSQIVELMNRKLRDSLQLSRQIGQPVDEEYRLSFFIGTSKGMGETKSYLGSQTRLLCAEEAKETTAALEAIVARQIAIFDPAEDGVGMGRQLVDVMDSKPLHLTLRFDICDSSQKILVTRLVSCRTPTYPLPPADEIRALMQRIWKNTYEVVSLERKSKRDSRNIAADVRDKLPPYKFCVSFDVLFGDAEHKWFGGLCYGRRSAEFSAYTLARTTRKVEDVFKEQLAIFEVLGELGWPEREGKREKMFVTTDGLGGKESRDSKRSSNVEKSPRMERFWERISGSSGRAFGEK